MCPFCVSTMAMVVFGAATSGGVAAIVIKKYRASDDAEKLISQRKGVESATENRLNQ